MNELMVDFGGGNWLYFKTNATTCEDAVAELDAQVQKVVQESFFQGIGLNIDNMKQPRNVELRDENGDTIDKIHY